MPYVVKKAIEAVRLTQIRIADVEEGKTHQMTTRTMVEMKKAKAIFFVSRCAAQTPIEPKIESQVGIVREVLSKIERWRLRTPARWRRCRTRSNAPNGEQGDGEPNNDGPHEEWLSPRARGKREQGNDAENDDTTNNEVDDAR